MSASQPEWVDWVAPARKNDEAAREQLETYFNPFVHAVVVSRVAHHLAGGVVREVMQLARQKLPTLAHDSDYATWLLELARATANQSARKPGATVEQPSLAEAIKDGRKVLSKLRALPEATRERLTMRLLEGVTGAEIAEVTGAGQSEVRNELERGLTQLCRDLTGSSVSAAGDAYLWSLVGNPHAAIIPLENQLTPLRYDPAADSADEPTGRPLVSSPEVTPASGAPLRTGVTEGRRMTPGEMVQIDDEDHTNPVGQSVLVQAEATAALGTPLPAGAGADFGSERTIGVTDLPAAAQVNPFEQQPSTIPVQDLPAAAVVHARAAGSRRTGEQRALAPAPAPVPPPRPSGETRAAPRTSTGERALFKPGGVAPRSSKPLPAMPSADADSTAPRGVPLSILAREHTAPEPVSKPQGTDWRSMVDDEPMPTVAVTPGKRRARSSLVRGWYPFAIAGFLFTVSLTVAWVNLRGSERSVRRGWNLVQVMVAAANLPEGTVINYDLVSTRGVPEGFVTSSVVKPDSVSYIIDQRIMVPVQAGDPLMWSQFEQARNTERLSGRVSKRARAYTLDASGKAAVGGWVRPGDHVDLIFTAREPQLKQLVAVTLLEDLPVIATGKLTASTNLGLVNASERQYRNVSVMVLPEEAEMLALMKTAGSFKLSLRNDDDNESLNDKGRSEINTLLSGERNKLLQDKRFRSIQMIRNVPSGAPTAVPSVGPLTPYPQK